MVSFSCVAMLWMTGYFLNSSLSLLTSIGVDVSISSIWKHGLSLDPITMYSLGQASYDVSPMTSFLNNLILANVFQVAISFFYVLYNNILTRQLVADELIGYMRVDGKKPLRVSSPIGMQRSSYFLSLPLRYSIPLKISAALLHWLTSQTTFLIETVYFEPGSQGVRIPEYDRSAQGYSLFGNVLLIVLGGVMIIALLINSLTRRFKDVPPIFVSNASNSAVIRALCQRPEGDTEAHLFPIRIGATRNSNSPDNAAKLAFSTDISLKSPKIGKTYFQPIIVRERGDITKRGHALL